jgi:hypothetical protein
MVGVLMTSSLVEDDPDDLVVLFETLNRTGAHVRTGPIGDAGQEGRGQWLFCFIEQVHIHSGPIDGHAYPFHVVLDV